VKAAQAKAQATEVVTNLAPLTEHPQAPPQVIANEALRPEDGLSVLADSSVLIGSSDFQWPTVNEPAPVLESEDLESNIETEPQVEPTSLVEDTSEVETHVVPPVVIPEIESEEPAKSTESPALSSSITNVDKDATGLEMDAKSAETVVVKPRIKPAWEVDRLLWPSDVDQLYESESEYFSHAGEKLLKASQEGLRVLGVSSTNEGEGCTTLTICLARAAAEAGAKVGLLDANLRSPQLGAALGLDFARSWHETLNGRIPLAEAAVTAIADNVTLMPLSKNAMHQGLTLDGDLINDILGQAAETFDLVLVDIGVLSEAGRSSFQAGTGCPLDAAIIVRDVRVTSEEETLETVNQFKELGIDAVGIAENFAPSAAVQAAA
jgi:Mrp family chromosome partitioning ATPase